MDDKKQNAGSAFASGTGQELSSDPVVSESIDSGALSLQPTISPQAAPPHPSRFARLLSPGRGIKRIALIVVAILVLGAFAVLLPDKQQSKRPAANGISVGDYGTINVPLGGVASPPDSRASLAAVAVVINGSLIAEGGMIIAPSLQPADPKPGQLYFDQDTNELGYYNGSDFVMLNGQAGVQDIAGLIGEIPLGAGLSVADGQLASTGVLSVQGQTGAVEFSAGAGVIVDGTTITNSGVISVVSSNPSLTVADDGSGNLTLDLASGSGTGTVTSPGGTAGRLAKFTGVQAIADSLLSESGATITVNGNLSVTGSTTLSTALTVANGGTGAASLTANGVLVGGGAGAVTSVAAGGAGFCLTSTIGAPAWASCTNAGNAVTALNGLSGALTVANASGAGSIITIDDATAITKGIASFNSTNFTVVGGNVNTVQNISNTSSPTFAGVNTNTVTSTGALTVGSAAQALSLLGNASSVFAVTGGGQTTTVGFAGAPTGAVNFNFDRSAAAGTYTICTTVANCAGIGGGVTTSGGTTNRLSKFTGSQTVGDSSLSDNGSLVTVLGSANLLVQGGTATFGTTTQAGSIVLHDGSSDTVTVVLSGQAGDRIYTIPDAGADADFCLSSGNCAGASGAPADAAYLVTTLNSGLSDERAFAAGSNVSLTDGGANGNFTVATVQNPTFSTSVTTPLLQSSGVLSISSAGGNAITVNAGTTIELQDDSNVTGNLDVSGGLNVGSSNAFVVSSAGAVTAATGLTSSGTITFSGLNCTTFANGGALTTNGTGVLSCTDDDGGAGSAISGSGTAGTVPLFNGAQTLTNSIITQSGTTVDIAGDLTLDTALTVGNGGTGATSFTTNGVLYGDGSNALQVSLAGSGGQVLLANGSGVPTFTSFSGDIAVSSAGATTIQANSVALTTDTTGSYVANLGSLTGLSTTGNSGEGSTPTLSVDYGSVANTAVQGNVTLTCASGTGNLTGGGNSVTLGAGGSCNNVTIVNSPTFSGNVTTSGLVLTGAGSNGSIVVGNLGTSTIYTLPDPVGGAADICLSVGNCTTAGTAGGDLTGTYPNPTIAKLQNTNLTISSPTAGHVLIYNGTASRWENHAVSSDVAISETGVATIQNNSVALTTDTSGNYVAGLTAGNGISITGSAGEGWSPTVTTLYGSSANTAVEGNTGITVTAGTNLTGGGSITLGAGGTVTLNVASSPTFSGSLTVQGGVGTFGTTTQAGSLVLSDGSSQTVTINTAILGADRIYTLPDAGGDAVLCTDGGNCLGGSGGAPNAAQYLVATLDATLTNERALAAGSNVSLTDGGAGGSFTVATVQNPTFTTSVTTPLLQSSGALAITSASSLTVTGNSSSTFVINAVTVDATEFNRLDGKDAALVDTNDAVNTAITGTGVLGAGSIASGFGAIDTGADNITTTGTVQGTAGVLTSVLDRLTAGTLSIGGTATQLDLGGNVTITSGSTFTSGTGTVLLQGNTDIAAGVSLATRRGTTYTTAGSANDVALNVASLYVLDTSGAAQTITGIAAGRDGQYLTLVNADTALGVTLSNQSGSSSANNRISTGTGTDIIVPAGGSLNLIYDTNSNLWRVIAGVAGGNGTCSGCANQQLSNLSSVNLNTALNATSANLDLTTTTSGNIVLNSAGTIDLQDNTSVTGTLGVSSTLTVSAGGASIAGNTTIANTAGNTLGLGNSTGTLTVTGNSSSTFVINAVTVDATEFNRLDGKDAALVDTNDAVSTAITGTGALGSGSIGSGFGSIDTGADNITTTGTLQGTNGVLTQSLDRTSAGALNIGATTATSIVLGQNTSMTGAATFTSGTGIVLLQGNTDVAASVSLATKRGATYTTAGSANDVALNVASLYVLDTSGAAQTITGIAAGRDGQYLTLVNGDATLTATLANLSGSSSANNRISTGTGVDVSIPAGGSISLIYDTASNLWRVVGGVAGGNGTCSGCANTTLSNLASVNINTALNATSTDLNLTTTTSGNIVLNSIGTIDLQDNTSVTGTLGVSSTLTVTTGGLTVSAGGASIAGNTTIATTAGNTLGLGNSTGALTVTGNSSSTFVINGVTVDATEFNRLDGKDAALVDTNDAVNTAITGTGALGAGSITSGFGSIDTGADNITTTGTIQGTNGVLTQSLDRTSAGALNIGATTATSIVLGQSTSMTGAATFTSGTGTVLLQGNTDVANTVSLATKRAATYTTAGSANDVALNVASLYILDTSGGAQTITGIAAGRDGQYLTLVNADSSLAVTLSNQSGSSSANSRISTGTGADISVAAGASVNLIYDTANNLWRIVGGVAGGNGTCSGCANQQLSNLSSVNLNTALNATGGNLNLTTTTSGNIVLNSVGTIELQDNTNVTGALGVSSTLTVSAGGADIAGNTTIATTAGNTLGLGNSTGTLTVTGNSSSTFVLNGVTVDATEFNRLDGKDAALVDANDAVNTAITGTGALNSGSITSGFGAIDTGGDNITTTGTLQGTTSVLTSALDRVTAGTLSIGGTATQLDLGGNVAVTGSNTFTSGTGLVLLQGNTDIAATKSLATRRGTTYTTAGSADNVALNVASLYVLDTSGAAQTLTGIAAGRDGQYLTLVNGDATLAVTLSNLSGSSSAANQISTGTSADVSLAAGASLNLIYDSASSLWRVVGGVAGGNGTCSGCANTSLSNLSGVDINAALNATAGNLNLTTTTSGNIVLNSAGIIDLQDNTSVTGTLGVSSTLTVSAGGLTVSAGGADIAGNTTIATTAGNTLGLGNSTGTLTVTGNSSSTFVINGNTVDATEFNRLDGKDAALVDTNDAVATAITGTGALNAGSITNGFGSIDTGADNITTTGTIQGTNGVLTQSLDRTSAGALNIGNTTATSIVLGQNTSMTGAATFTSGTGIVLLQGNTDVANTVSLATKRGATYTTAGSANDVALNVASLYILDTSGAAQTITGIAAGRDGQHLTLVNADASLAVTLNNLSGSSSANNRISTGTGTDVLIPAEGSIDLVYDTASNLWRVVGGLAGGAGTCSTCANLALSNLSSVNIGTALNATSGNLNLTTTTSGNIVLNSAGTIELQDNTNVTGTLSSSSTLTVSAGGASIIGNTTIASTAGNTLDLGNSTGALTATGNSSSTFVINGSTVDATEFNRLDGRDAALVDTNDAVATAIIGTGALNAGSITSGFGSIDVGTDGITTTGTVAAGNITASGTYNTNTFTASSLQFGAASTASIQSASGQALTLTGHGTSAWGTDAGNLTLQATANATNLTLTAGDNLATALADGNDIELRAEDDVLVALSSSGQFFFDASTNVDSTINNVNSGTIVATIDASVAATGRQNGIYLDYQVVDDANTDQEFRAFKITLRNSEDSGDYIEGLNIANLDDAANGVTDSLLSLVNDETAAGTVDIGIRILGNAGGGLKTINTGIAVNDDNITTAINVGANTVLGTTATLDFTSFDLTGSTGAVTFQNVSNSTTAFRILSDTSSSSVPQFVADTTNSRIYIGNPTADATGALLVLDTKNDAGDPTSPVDGGMYYNSNSGKFRCRQSGVWRDCIGSTAIEYVRAEMRTVQNTAAEVDQDDHVKFATVDASSGSSITLDTSSSYVEGGTGASIGRFTLAAGKTYKLSANIPYFQMAAAGNVDFSWYNVTGSSLIGSNGGMTTTNNNFSDTHTSPAEAIITTGGTTLVEVRLTSIGGSTVNSIGFATTPQLLYPNAFVEVLSDGSQVAQFQGATAGTAGASGFVPGPAAGQQGSVLLGDGTWSTGVTFLSGAATFQNASNSTTAFRILRSTGTPTPLFVVDSSNSRVYIGDPTGDTSGALLVLDTKTDAGDPTGVNGGMYYSTSTNTFRCYEHGSWLNCVSGLANHDAFWVKGTATDFVSVGVADMTNSGTLANSNANVFTSVKGTTGAVAGNTAGFISPTFDLTRLNHKPTCSIVVKSPSGGTTTGARIALGIFSAAPANANDFGGNHLAFKYSTVAGDTGVSTGWRVSTRNGTTNTISGSNISGSANMANDTEYKLKFRVESSTQVYVSVNGGTEESVTTTLPTATQDLGIAAQIITSDTNADQWNFSRFYCEQSSF